MDACSEAVPSRGCGGRACSWRSSCSSRASTRPIARIASRPSRGRLPCAARPRVSTSSHAKPLCATPICRSVGSVTTAGVGAPRRAPARRRRCWRTPRPPPPRRSAVRREARSAGRRAPRRSSPRRRPSCPATRARTTGRRRSRGSNGAVHAVDADGVDVAAEHQRAAGRAARRARRSRWAARARPPARAPRGPAARMCAATASAAACSPAAPGTSDGLTEFTLTRRCRSAIAGSWDDRRMDQDERVASAARSAVDRRRASAQSGRGDRDCRLAAGFRVPSPLC